MAKNSANRDRGISQFMPDSPLPPCELCQTFPIILRKETLLLRFDRRIAKLSPGRRRKKLERLRDDVPRGSDQKRPTGVRSKPANGSGPELLEVVPDRELSEQGKSGLFPQSSPKNAFRSPPARFLEVVHGSSHGFSGPEWSVCDLVLQLRGPHLRM
jgi:hypothetical protein